MRWSWSSFTILFNLFFRTLSELLLYWSISYRIWSIYWLSRLDSSCCSRISCFSFILFSINSSIIESLALSISPSDSGSSSSYSKSSISSTNTSQICESASWVAILSELEYDPNVAVLVLKELLKLFLILSRLFLIELSTFLRDLAFSLS